MTQCRKTMAYVMVAGVMLAGGLGRAAEFDFSLTDSYGRQVKSQEYEGVPLFLEFGACW